MDGFPLETPGFCYNRLTDFICYIWVKPLSVGQVGDEMLENGETGLNIISLADYEYERDHHHHNNNSSNMSYSTGYDYGDYGDYYSDNQSERYLTLTLAPVFLLLGTVGNLVSLIVLLRLSHEVLSTCVYLAVLCVADLIVLYTRCGNQWLLTVTELDVSTMLMMYSTSVCKVYPFVFNFILHLMRWLIVCAAVEGALSTKYPDKVHQLCTTSKAEAIMLLLTVLLVCVNIHFFWSFELIHINDGPADNMYRDRCTFTRHGHQTSEVFQNYIWPIADTLITDGVPSTLVTICAIFMLVKIGRGQHRGTEGHQAWRERYQLDPVALDQLKITILLVCILFLPSSLPKMLVNLVTYLFEKEYINYGGDYMAFTAKRNTANSICANLEYAYLSCKIFIYLATSHRFRTEATRMVRCSCRRYGIRDPLVNKRSELTAKEPLMGHCNNSLHSSA